MDKKHIKLLVVEDNEAHVLDLNGVLEDLGLGYEFPLNLEVCVVSTLAGALAKMSQTDWVMTDVFFPDVPGGDATQPNGKKVVEACIATQKPVVWITSTYHHGTMTNAVSEWGRDRGLEMFDCPIAGRGSEEAPHKPWKEALYGLIYTALAIEIGLLRFKDGQIQQRQDCASDFYAQSWIDRGKSLRYLSTENIENDSVMKKMLEMGFPRE